MNTFYLVVSILTIPGLIGLMKIFQKAGFNQWYALIPFYNAYIWLKVIEKPLWWLIFVFMPFINIFMLFLMFVETVKTFNKNLLWEQALAAIFSFAYLPYLGFSENEKYQLKEQRPPFTKSKTREWVDAIIFAVFAATIIRTFVFEAYTIPTPSMEKSLLVGDYLFVSKLTYGPKIPNTPIAFPFVHHTMPLSATAKSYVEWITLPYHRYFGFKTIKNNDVVVFNYPSGDTVVLERQNEDYYQIVRSEEMELNDGMHGPYKEGMGRKNIWKTYHVVARPVDKRENYIKRCIGIAGDTLKIIDQEVYINGKIAEKPENLEFQYYIIGNKFGPKELQKMGMSNDDIDGYTQFNKYPQARYYLLNEILPFTTADSLFSAEELSSISMINLTDAMAQTIKKSPKVNKLVKVIYKAGAANNQNAIFPHSPIDYPWNQDNFGPIIIPQKGQTVAINMKNIVLYKKIIEIYEQNTLKITDNQILINGIALNNYTFKMNYYWMMGDNRQNSADSRFWGFVPEDHIVGTPSLIWLSLDKDKSLTKGKIRWDRIFKLP
jgi:signal peptidase I